MGIGPCTLHHKRSPNMSNVNSRSLLRTVGLCVIIVGAVVFTSLTLSSHGKNGQESSDQAGTAAALSENYRSTPPTQREAMVRRAVTQLDDVNGLRVFFNAILQKDPYYDNKWDLKAIAPKLAQKAVATNDKDTILAVEKQLMSIPSQYDSYDALVPVANWLIEHTDINDESQIHFVCYSAQFDVPFVEKMLKMPALNQKIETICH
jgi:hypothetical protein